jgi:geranylgeranyl diphosphate synthase, type I
LKFVQERKVDWVGTPFAPVLDALERFVLDGDKRIRPAMCQAGYLIGGGSDEAALVPAAASLELWHSFALIHDDITDGSTTRRGARTIHCGLTALHQLSGWRGDIDRFDEREVAVSVALHTSELTGERRDVIEELILRCTDRDH